MGTTDTKNGTFLN